MADIITGTPPDLTYGHWLVQQAWMVVWAFTSAALVVIFGWMGLSFIISEHLGRAQAGWREMVPRLVLGLVAAASSLWWCTKGPGRGRRRVRLHRRLPRRDGGRHAALHPPHPAHLRQRRERGHGPAAGGPLPGLRLLRPLRHRADGAAPGPHRHPAGPGSHRPGLWILPHTAGWGRHWLRLFITTVFQQAVQLIALALGFGFLKEFAAIAAFEPVQDLIWKLLMSLAFVYMATRVPSMLGNYGTFDSWLSTLYFGMNLPSSLMRSARTIGLVSGGAAGGPGGMAVGAMAASARRLRWPRHRAAEETATTPPRAARVAPQQRQPNGAAPSAPINQAKEVGRCASRRVDATEPIATSRTLWNREEKRLMADMTQTISNLVGVVGSLGVGFFIYGAYLYLTASGAPHQMERGKTKALSVSHDLWYTYWGQVRAGGGQQVEQGMVRGADDLDG